MATKPTYYLRCTYDGCDWNSGTIPLKDATPLFFKHSEKYNHNYESEIQQRSDGRSVVYSFQGDKMLSQVETPTSASPLPDTSITVRNDTPTATTPAASVTPLVSDSLPLNPDVSIPVIATTQTKPSDQPFSPVGAFDGMPSAGIIGI